MSKPDRCPTCKRRLTRNHDQNARYWALLHAITDKVCPGGNAYSAEQWHIYAKSRWLGCDDVILPNGKTLTIPRSTANLDVSEFGDYMTAVEAWANERGVFLEDDLAA